MPRRTHDEERPAPRRRSPANTPEEREQILIAKSLDLIESQIDDGSVSSQVLSIFAKESTTRAKRELERLDNENAVLRQKVKTMQAAVDIKDLMEEALAAFTGYEGEGDYESDDVPEDF